MKVGDVVKYQDNKWEVIRINFSRARLRCLGKVKQIITNKRTKEEKTIMVRPQDISIAPDSECPVVGKTKRKTPKREYCCGFLMPVED